MKFCCHCGATNTPCWRRGPPDKPRLCNACGAHHLVKHTLNDGYWPGRRTASSSASPAASDASCRPRNTPPAKRRARSTTPAQHKQHQQQRSPACSLLSSFETSADNSTSQSIDHCQEGLVEVEQPAVVSGSQLPAHDGGSSRKRSRLGAGCVYEDDPRGAPRCKRTFQTPDGGVMTVVRRRRKQLQPRSSTS